MPSWRSDVSTINAHIKIRLVAYELLLGPRWVLSHCSISHEVVSMRTDLHRRSLVLQPRGGCDEECIRLLRRHRSHAPATSAQASVGLLYLHVVVNSASVYRPLRLCWPMCAKGHHLIRFENTSVART